ncbi:class I SAM-dependent methyltransferase [Sulfurovum sp. zt1-1]|uniref:Class I SAM-dependent methyltransferase n=1 Tax=Sulfurovum zhangzhouensis TaxID=3019067 RepID=A0ABT7QZF2_9BACT|nr:class I SAM-dependent methyltransferase [Sulfurovum zhangzhouensis]MDM5272167.1 class I SAM-dependent methyltransferase [Sulfurovum zhangzhouensis]
MPTNTSESLDLYAKVEDLLGIEEATPRLYAHYLLFLQSIQPKTLLDVGCGSGDFLVQMKKALKLDEAKGVDLSPIMVERTKSKGVDAECIDLCDLDGKYDVITAVFDMVNYLDAKSLKRFLGCIADHLNDGGYFVFDVNTLYGFENVAVGAFIVDDEERFLAIDSDFEKKTYEMELTLFEKKNNSFVKSKEMITQHFHTLRALSSHKGLELIKSDEVELYEMGEPDKLFIVLQKR